ncbi:MAG: NAD+ synthase [Acidobacteria bacterium]|nr:NAD+ synthase [Acidobacteriota bacterium]
MRVALAQINTIVGDVAGNRDRVLVEMQEAQKLGADLVLFPELCLTGYPPRDMLGIHGFVKANLHALREIAARTDRMGVIVGFVDRNASGEGKDLFNAAALLAEGGVQAIVHKTLLPTYDVFDEDRYFEKSRETRVIPFRSRRLGISICEDAWNAEDFWPRPLYRTDPIRSLVEGGADLLLNISASPYELNKPRFRYAMLLDHVRKHRVPLVYVNLVGGNDDLIFDGNSLAIGRRGNLSAQARSFEEDRVLVDTEGDTDLEYAEAEPMPSLFSALVLGTRDYARKCGFKSAVLGLSGGIDSAVTACIAAEAFGAQNVLGVSMPSVYSMQASEDDARTLALRLGIRFEVIPIQPLFQEYVRILAPAFVDKVPDTTEENIQARIRGNILMALSNKFGHLVLSTGNKSELGVGYCTLYGDMAGGLAVISDVPKTVVYQLAAYVNRDREIIPANTIRRAPTAELRPGQTDQDTLPDYEVLDGILRLRVEHQMSVDEIVAQGYDRETVADVARMIHASEYKRRQAAPGLKVSPRAFGTGRRMPIASRLNY